MKLRDKAEVTRQMLMQSVRRLHHLNPLPLFSPSDEEEECWYNLSESEK